MISCSDPRKIGIYGGSFNPVHNGHITVAKVAMAQEGLSLVYFVPAKDQPFKGVPSASADDRVRMLKLSLSHCPRFLISMYELQKEGVSYSVETAAYFKDLFPDASLYFIMGQDSYDTLPLWHESETLCSIATPLVVTRRATEGAHRKIVLPAVKVVMPPIDISSSQIRQTVAQGGVIPEGVLDPKVEAYIKEKGLYRHE